MRQKSQHTFQVLTKRPQRAVEFYYWLSNQHFESVDASWFPNIWVGVTAENQEQADIRIPLLLQIPAAVRFVSVEPMLSKVDIYTKLIPIQRLGGVDWVKLDWVICGGETGPGARPLHPDWVRSLRDQCVAARVPFYFKQWGEWVDGQNVPEAHLDAALDCAGDAQRDYRYMGARGETQMFRIERRRAGHLLDGVEWRQFPEVV
jgi:protein gp37